MKDQRSKSLTPYQLSRFRSKSGLQINFYKDVIMPNIYDIQNIRLIGQHAYPESPKNKVLQMRKQKFDRQVMSVFKSKKQTNMKASSYNYRPSSAYKYNSKSAKKITRPSTALDGMKKISSRNLAVLQQNGQLDQFDLLDQRILQIGRFMEDDHAPLKDRVQALRDKLKIVQQRKKYPKSKNKCQYITPFPIEQPMMLKGKLFQTFKIQRKPLKSSVNPEQKISITPFAVRMP